MGFFSDGLIEAVNLVLRGDREVFHAVFVTVLCTTTAVTLAAAVAIPYGAWLGLHRRDGRGPQVFLVRVGMFTQHAVTCERTLLSSMPGCFLRT